MGAVFSKLLWLSVFLALSAPAEACHETKSCKWMKQAKAEKSEPVKHATIPDQPPKDAPSRGVDEYLCEVYSRLPAKIDSSGDFTWKDPAAANRLGLSLCDYTIGGMDPDLRESLAAMGKRADEEGINWSFLSAYRDEYRQRIAVGFKAGPCGSWHGARSCGNKGYGRGRAADLWVADQHGNNANPNPLFQFIDKIGQALGLIRPMRGRDPAHVEVSWDFRKKAAVIRHTNAKVARDNGRGQGDKRYAGAREGQNSRD